MSRFTCLLPEELWVQVALSMQVDALIALTQVPFIPLAQIQYQTED
jgi:hypothetical protein